MKIYQIKKFFATGWNEGHRNVGKPFAKKEDAEREFKALGLKISPHGNLWGDYIEEIKLR